MILPSWNEGQPLVLLEAMSQGILIIATDAGFVRELLGEAYPYIYKPGDKRGLRQMIYVYSEDRDKKKLSDYLKTRYYKFYCREKHKVRLLEIFS